MPECQGSVSSVINPSPVFVRAPLEKRNMGLLHRLAVIASATTVVAPIERVRLLMQSQNALIQSGRLSQPYKGIFNCFARTIRNEGIISLWRGNTARLISRCSSGAIFSASTSYA